MSITYGCSGGGGGGGRGGGGGAGSTDPNFDFPLYELGALDAGFVATGNLSGTVKVDGLNYAATGTFHYETFGSEFLATVGLDVIPIETLITVTIPLLTIDISILTTNYLNDESGNYEPVFLEVERDDGSTVTLVTATPIEVNLLPDTGQVGDFGKLTSWDYDDGNTSTETWSLKSSTPGFANKVFYRILRDSVNDIISDASTTRRIDEDGDLVHLIYTDDTVIDGRDVLINLSGDRN